MASGTAYGITYKALIRKHILFSPGHARTFNDCMVMNIVEEQFGLKKKYVLQECGYD
jgi:hypothetical protein